MKQPKILRGLTIVWGVALAALLFLPPMVGLAYAEPEDEPAATEIPDQATEDAAAQLAPTQLVDVATEDAASADADELVSAELSLNLIQSQDYDPAQSEGPELAASISSATRTKAASRINTAFMNIDTTVDLADLKIPYDESLIVGIVDSVVNTNPDLFYVGADMTVYYNKSTKLIDSIKPDYYYPVSKIPSMKANYEKALANLLSWVPPEEDATDVQRLKAVHDWLVRYNSYNNDAAELGADLYGPGPWSAYGALVDKKPVCEGYSLAFMAACTRLGYSCTFVKQFSGNSGHGWNRVQVEGNWYNVDVTFDDTVTPAGFNATIAYDYFMKSDAWFKANPIGSYRWHATWSPAGTASKSARYDTYDDSSWLSPVYTKAWTKTKAKSFELSKTYALISTNATLQLSIINAKPVETNTALATWKSSDPTIAAVDSAGKVTSGQKEGLVTISCTLDGVSHTTLVHVGPGVPVYRVYNPRTTEHLYTTDKNEVKVLTTQRGWKNEGLQWNAPTKSKIPVYRLYSPVTHEHLYTRDANERKVLSSRGWNDEGIKWYGFPESYGLPVWRLYHPRAKQHLFTTSSKEYKVLSSGNWNDEKIAWYGLPAKDK